MLDFRGKAYVTGSSAACSSRALVARPGKPGTLRHVPPKLERPPRVRMQQIVVVTVLASEFSMLLLVSGHWNTLSKFENQVPKLGKQLGLTLSARRTEERVPRHDLIPYAIDVVCLDQPGIVFNLAHFFAERNIGVADLATRTYPADHTGAPMFSVQMAVNIPAY